MASKFTRQGSREFYDEMVQLGMCGLSMKECGDYYELDPMDWVEWCEKHPLAEASYNTGRARGVALASQQLLRQIKEGKMSAIMFYLKTLGGFTEKSVMELASTTKTINVPPPPMPTDPVEAAKVYAQFMKDS